VRVRVRECLRVCVGAQVCANSCARVALCAVKLACVVSDRPVASMTPPYSSTLSRKWHDFRKKKLLNLKCVLILFQNLPKAFLILRRIQRGITIKLERLRVKYPLFL
jgi:hypothetical protein